MAKKTWVNIGGVNKEVKNVWHKANGIWKEQVVPSGVINSLGWKQFMEYKRYIYKPGIVVEPLKSFYFAVTYEAGSIYANYRPSNTAWLALSTVSMVDVTNYTSLYFDVEIIAGANTDFAFGLSKDSANTVFDSLSTLYGTSIRQLVKVNITNASGSFYVKFVGPYPKSNYIANRQFRIYNIWME